MPPIKLLDLHAEFPLFESAVRQAIDECFADQRFINGPQVAQLEQEMASRLGVAHAVGVSSGTDALLIAMMAIGVGPGDEVVTTPFTFFATAGCIQRLGARPVFVDIEPDTFNLDPAKVRAALTPRTKAIMPVHLFGQCADMDALAALARAHDIPLIEDAAQAIGARYHDRCAGALGLMGCFSFYPTKNLGGFGEGGLVTTVDDELARRLGQLRNHGQTGQYEHSFVGGNFRLDTIAAAVLLAKLPHLDAFNERRRHNAARYEAQLADVPGVATPVIRAFNLCVYHQYCILTSFRDELRAALTEQEIGTGIYYPLPLHLQPCFAHLGFREGDLPVAEEASRRILALPIHPMLTDGEVDRVAAAIAEFAGKRASLGAPAGQSQ